MCKIFTVIFFLLGMQITSFASDGVSAAAESVFACNGLLQYFTNSLLTSMLVSFGIVFAVRLITRKGISMVPNAGQACIENLLEGLGSILEPIVGRHTFLKIFPLLIGYFVFILINNLSGLVPGIGSVGFYEGQHFNGIFRPMNADLNATLALAIVATCAWMYVCTVCVGPKGLYEHIFGNKADPSEVKGIMWKVLLIIFLGVGCIECISIACRVVSLSFRLFGNVFGGENLLHNMYEMSEFLISGQLVNTDFYAMVANFSPWLANCINIVLSKIGYFLPLPFYFLEFLVGFVQAFVFTLLVAVYIGLICNHEDEEKHLA